MARGTIKQRIALDGGKEIRDELLELGRAGEKVWAQLQRGAREFKGPDNTAVTKLKEIQNQLEATGKAFAKVGQDLKSVGTGLSTYITAPVAAAGAGIVKVAADFESAMNDLRVNTQATGDEFQKLSDLARQIGKDTTFGPQEAAQAMSELAKVGVSTTDILGGAAKAVVEFATANRAELAPSATVAADLMKQFGISVKDLPATLQDVSGTLNKSKLDFDGYRSAIGQVGGVAGLLGVSLHDLNDVLGSTASSFGSGADAATSFKTFILALPGISDKATETIKKFGLQFFTSSGQLRSFGEIADELRTKLGRLDDRALETTLKELFGGDAFRTGLALMKEGSAGLRDFRAEVQKFDQAKAAEVRMQGFNGQLKQLQGSLEELAITIGQSGVLEWATNLVKGLSRLVDSLREVSPEVLKVSLVIAGIAAAVGPVLGTLGLMTIGFGGLVTGLGKVTGVLANVAKGFTTLGTGQAVGVFQKIGQAAAALRTGPLALLLGWPALFATALVGLIKFWPQITAAADTTKKALIISMGDLKLSIERALAGDWSGAWVAFSRAAAKALDQLKQDPNLKGFIEAIEKTIEDTKREWLDLKAFFENNGLDLGTNTLRELESVVKGIHTALEGIKSDFGELGQFIAKIASGDIAGAWAMIAKQPTEAAQSIKAAVAGIVSDTTTAAEQVRAALKFGGPLPFGELGSAARTQANEIARAFSTAGQDADREMRVASERIRSSFAGIKEAAQSAVREITVNGKTFKVPVEVAGVPEAKAAVDQIAQKFKEITVNGVTKKVPVEVTGVPAAITAVDQVVQKFKEITVNGVSRKVPIEVTGVEAAKTQIAEVQTAISTLINQSAASPNLAQDQATGVNPFHELLDRATELQATLPDAVKTATDAVLPIFDQLQTDLGTRAEATATDVDGKLSAIGGGVTFAPIVADADAAFAKVTSSADLLATAIPAKIGDATISIKSLWDDMTSYISSAVDGLLSTIDSVIQKLADMARAAARNLDSSDPSSSGTGANFGSGFASGGHVRGRGTSTSDSILSWLSNNEFVVQAKAVRKYGLDFLHALNSGRLKLPGFAEGGHVQKQQFKFNLPAFSAGGLADGLSSMMGGFAPRVSVAMPSMAGAGGTPINLYLPSGEVVTGLTGTDSAIDQIQRHAGRKRMASAGRKPGWF